MKRYQLLVLMEEVLEKEPARERVEELSFLSMEERAGWRNIKDKSEWTS